MRVYSKVKGMTLAGAIVAIVAGALRVFAGIELPADVVSSLIVVVAFVVGFYVPERVGG